MKKVLPLAVSAALLAGAAAAAQAEISANVTLTTDYLFRGISQTGEKGAIQGGFDYSHESGAYAGVWASSVNFDTETSTEMDYYIGYAGETEGGFGYDIGYIYFDYEGDSEFDYQEIALGFSYGDFGFGVNYSDEYLGDGGPDFLYPYIDYSTGLGENLSLSLHVGYSDIDADGWWEEGEDASYTDYNIALGYSVSGVDLSLGYYDTDIDNLDAADGRVVFSISKSL